MRTCPPVARPGRSVGKPLLLKGAVPPADGQGMPRVRAGRVFAALPLLAALALGACATEEQTSTGGSPEPVAPSSVRPSTTTTTEPAPPPSTTTEPATTARAPGVHPDDLSALASQVVSAIDQMAASLDRVRWSCSPEAPAPPRGAGLDLCTSQRRTGVPVAAGWARTIVLAFDGIESFGGRIDDARLQDTATLARSITNAVSALPVCSGLPGVDCGALDEAINELLAQVESLLEHRPAWENYLA